MAEPGGLLASLRRYLPIRRSQHDDRKSQGFVVVGVVVALTVSTLAAVFGSSQHAQLINLLSGHGWVSSRHTGTVMLANGATGSIDLKMQISGAAGHRLQVLQSGNTAELVDNTSDTISSIDLSQFKVGSTQGLTSKSQPPSNIDVEVAPRVVYVIYRRTGVIQARSPLNNRVIGSFNVGGDNLSAGVVDSTGRLWALNLITGTLVSASMTRGRLQHAEGSQVVRGGINPAQVELAIVQDNPVVLDLATHQLIDAPDGVADHPINLALPSDETIATAHMPTTVNGSEIPLTVDRVGIIIANASKMTASSPTFPTDIATSDRLGDAEVAGDKLFVADLTKNDVVPLRVEGNSLIPVAPPLQLTGRIINTILVSLQGGYFWFDNPNSATAVAVSPDGQFALVRKDQPVPISNGTTTTTQPQTITASTLPNVVPTPAPGPGTTPPQPPSAPTTVSAVAGNQQATVSWSGELANGSPITKYTVSWTIVSGSGSKGSQTASSGPFTVTGLTNGTSYLFAVSATNALGTSASTPATSPVTPSRNVPDPPQSVTATAKPNGSIVVQWSQANFQGVSPGTYDVLINDVTSPAANSTPIPVTSTSTTLTASSGGLMLGDSYNFKVESINANQTASAPSAASNTVTASTVPIGVSGLSAKENGAGSISVNWTCNPTSATCSGGSTVTNFPVTLSPAVSPAPPPLPATSGTSSYTDTVTGLNPGTTYTVYVGACNANGCVSNSNLAHTAVQAVGNPGAPGFTTSPQVNGNSITWNWSQPSTGGSTISQYNLTLNGSPIGAVGGTSYTASNLAYSTTYTLSVSATNAAGLTGPAASQAGATGPPPPSVSFSWGQYTTSIAGCSGGCWWMNVSWQNFPANTTLTQHCFDNTGQWDTWVIHINSGSGSGSFAPTDSNPNGCAGGTAYTGYYVTLNGVASAAQNAP